MSERQTRNRRRAPATKQLLLHDVTLKQVGDHIGKSTPSIGFALEGFVRLDPAILQALLEMTGDASFVADVQRLSKESWIEQHPRSDPDTHLLGSDRQAAS